MCRKVLVRSWDITSRRNEAKEKETGEGEGEGSTDRGGDRGVFRGDEAAHEAGASVSSAAGDNSCQVHQHHLHQHLQRGWLGRSKEVQRGTSFSLGGARLEVVNGMEVAKCNNSNGGKVLVGRFSGYCEPSSHLGY